MQQQSYRPEDFESIVSKYEHRLYRTAVAITANPSDAQDIVQEVFLRRYEKAPAFESEEHETAWLIRVTVNLSNNRLRSFWRKTSVPLLDIHPAQEPEQQALLEQVLALPRKYRTVIHLFYYEDYSIKEISTMTNQKEGTVRSLLSRARQKLKTLIEEEAHEEISRVYESN